MQHLVDSNYLPDLQSDRAPLFPLRAHALQALPPAAACLLSPARTSFFAASPTARGPMRHSALFSSPPYKMSRLHPPVDAAGGGGPAQEEASPMPQHTLPHLPATPAAGGTPSSADAGGGSGAASRGVGFLLGGDGGGGRNGSSRGGGVAMQLFSAFGGAGGGLGGGGGSGNGDAVKPLAGPAPQSVGGPGEDAAMVDV